MKKISSILFIAVFLRVVNAFAQDTTHMLMNLKFVKPQYIGLYIAPEVQLGQLNNNFTSLGGGSVMLLLNRKWGIGVSVFENLNRSFSPKGIAPLYLRAHIEGVKLEYTPNPGAAIHINFPLVVGMGMAQSDSLKNENSNLHDRFDNDNGRRNGNEWFIVQPGIQVEANMIRYIKFFVGANYRLAFKTETITLPTNTMTGLSINLGVKLGIFDYWIGKKQE